MSANVDTNFTVLFYGSFKWQHKIYHIKFSLLSHSVCQSTPQKPKIWLSMRYMSSCLLLYQCIYFFTWASCHIFFCFNKILPPQGQFGNHHTYSCPKSFNFELVKIIFRVSKVSRVLQIVKSCLQQTSICYSFNTWLNCPLHNYSVNVKNQGMEKIIQSKVRLENKLFD